MPVDVWTGKKDPRKPFTMLLTEGPAERQTGVLMLTGRIVSFTVENQEVTMASVAFKPNRQRPGFTQTSMVDIDQDDRADILAFAKVLGAEFTDVMVSMNAAKMLDAVKNQLMLLTQIDANVQTVFETAGMDNACYCFGEVSKPDRATYNEIGIVPSHARMPGEVQLSAGISDQARLRGEEVKKRETKEAAGTLAPWEK